MVERSKTPTVNFYGDNVNVHSDKLLMFRAKGCRCAKCGLEGEYFVKEKKESSSKAFKLQLYGVRDEKPVLMTVDHIIPRAKGGENKIYNMQPMCVKCNSE